MKRLIPVVAAILIAFAARTHAHAHLHSSTPANHSTLASAPTSITLEFQEAVQLTALAIQKSNATLQKIGPLPTTASRTFTLPLPALDAGHYVVTWRAVSDDRHVMSDKLEFTVSPAPAK
jgi:methionine-rich copper-binding protein CopC